MNHFVKLLLNLDTIISSLHLDRFEVLQFLLHLDQFGFQLITFGEDFTQLIEREAWTVRVLEQKDGNQL